MSVTFSSRNAGSARELGLRDAYRVLDYLGMPVQDYGVGHSLPGAEFSRRLRGAWQMYVMYPAGQEAFAGLLRDLIRLGDCAADGDVSWGL